MTAAEKREALRPHPTRDRVLDLLRAHGHPLSPTQMARILGTSLSATAYHVRTLHEAGVLELCDEVGGGSRRGAVEHFYGLVDERDSHIESRAPRILALAESLTMAPEPGALPLPVPIDEVLDDELSAILADVAPRVQAAARRAVLRAQDRQDEDAGLDRAA
jgi:DNA-binding transcriptional ArsR family regulator